MLAGVLAGCQNISNQDADNAAYCKDYYGLIPGSDKYNDCIENNGEPFKRTEVIT